VKDSSSSWYFDTKAGVDEVLARRIGRNEITAIDACSAIANSEEVYARQPHDGNPKGLYTTKIFSTSGKQDGLYWEVPRDQEASPFGRVEDFAKDALLTPNESPVIVSRQGIMFQQDLGPNTEKVASETQEYNPTTSGSRSYSRGPRVQLPRRGPRGSCVPPYYNSDSCASFLRVRAEKVRV
jgi:hypothetical protein